MLLDIIFISFLVALVRGGRVREFPKFNKVYLLVITIALQVCAVFLPFIGGVFISIAYVFILAFLLFNREFEDMRIFLVGWFLNAIAIWTNGGKMPIDPEQAKKLPFDFEPVVNGTNFKHSVLTESSNLPFLTDVIYMPSIIPRIISIGDIFIMLGAFLLVQRLMNKPISLIQLREGKSYATKK
jgi:purine-cytosine permease-like protein